jgi:hypothetical protein
VTTRTARKWLARLRGFGYLINHKQWVELHDDLVLTDDSLLMADLPPLSDEQFARLQLGDDPDELLTEYAGRKLFLDLPRALIAGPLHPKRS